MGDDSGDTGEAVLESLRMRIDALSEALTGMEGELRYVRATVDEVIGRLDDGLVLADDIVAPPPSVPAELREVLATLREDMATGFDALRGMPQAEGLPVEVGRFSDHAVEELRAELVALRRRIKVRAEGRVLSDEQLEQIADVIVRRLAYRGGPTKAL